MKLFIPNCHFCRNKIPLSIEASTKEILRYRFHGNNIRVLCPICQNSSNYSIRDEIRAETDTNTTSTGAVIGGLIGLLGGPIGALVGGGIGGLIGNDSDTQDRKKVSRFNQSH